MQWSAFCLQCNVTEAENQTVARFTKFHFQRICLGADLNESGLRIAHRLGRLDKEIEHVQIILLKLKIGVNERDTLSGKSCIPFVFPIQGH